jgi:general secretion pathway protein L
VNEHTPAALIKLRPDDGGARFARRVVLAAVAGTLLLALIAGGLEYRRQQAAIDDLDVRVAAAKANAQRVRAAMDKLDQQQAGLINLRARKARVPSLLDIWSEATRVLPAHSWLTELRLTETPDKGQQVAMSGLSTAAASLVGVIDQSALFGETSLTAAIAMDPVEAKERFALQARTKRQAKP